MAKTTKPTGKRSGVRTSSLADAIVQGIADGTPLRELCRIHGISKSEVYRWQEDDVELRGRIARARIDGFDAIAEECLEIADDATNDWMKRRKGEEEVDAFDAEHVQRSKLRIETRLKLLAKWDPKRYGEKLALGGAEDLPPIQSETTLSPAEAYKRMLGGG